MAQSLLMIEKEEFEIDDDDFRDEMINKGAIVQAGSDGKQLSAAEIAESDEAEAKADEEGEEPDDKYYILVRDYAFTVEDIEALIQHT